MRGGPPRGPEERAVDLRPTFREAGALQEAVVVEHADDLLDVRSRDDLALVPAAQVGLDASDRVLAIEEGHDVEQGLGQEQHRLRVAGGVAKRDEALAPLGHGKGFDATELRGLHQVSRKFSAATV